MIQVTNLSKAYADQVLFDRVSFSLNSGERVGLVGRNGHGKSTLFKILLGQEDADDGSINFASDYRIGHLEQHLSFSRKTVLEEGCLGLQEHEDGIDESYKVKAILEGLGFSQEDFEKSPDQLSGGFQVRLNLAKLLVSEPNLLLLDEPTNYLDIVSTRWITRFLRTWPHEMMIITHDRDFMNRVTTHTMGIHRQKIRKIEGSTEKLYDQIEMEEEVHEKTRLNQERQRAKDEVFIRRFRAKASKAKSVQSRIKKLEKMETLDKLETIETLRFDFSAAPFEGKRVLDMRDVEFGYDPDNLLIPGLEITIGKHDRIAVIGKNGKGKSTLLRLLAEELQPLKGKISTSPQTELAYFGQTNVDRLDPSKTIEEEILSVMPINNTTRARGIAGLMMFEGERSQKQVKVLSGGEKSRTLLGKILVTPANLLLLDEPSNHLDMQSTDSLVQAIHRFSGAVVIVTHSEMILHQIPNRLIVLDGGKVFHFDGSYQDFLERVGWKDEGLVERKAKKAGGATSKELRQKRAEIISRRSKAVNPLKKKIEATEEKIMVLEKEVEEQNARLLEITKDGYSQEAADLSRKIHTSKEKIERMFAELEETSHKLETESTKFARELDALEG